MKKCVINTTTAISNNVSASNGKPGAVSRSAAPRLALLLFAAAAAMGVPEARAATLTWDPGNTSNGAIIDPANGTWNTTAGNIVWNNAGANVIWAAANQAVFGGADGTYAITVGGSFSAEKILFANSGYTLSAGSAQTITITSGGGAGTQPGLAVNPGKTATIGTNVTMAGSGTLYIGDDNGNSGGTLDIENGATVRPGSTTSIVIDGVGTVVNVKTGGTLNSGSANGSVAVGQLANAVNSLNVQGGSVSVPGTGVIGLLVGNNGQGTVTLTSGAITINASATAGVTFGNSGTSVGANSLNLNSGTLTTPIVKKGAGTSRTATFNFNGGAIVANASTATFMEGLDFAYVKAGGAKIDTQAYNITIAQNLLDGTGGGGLAKSGSGTLTLSGANTYTGVTTNNGGTLKFDQRTSLYNGNTALWTANNLVVESGAVAAFKFGSAGEFTEADIGTLQALGTATGGFKGGSFIGLWPTTQPDDFDSNFNYNGNIVDPGGNKRGLVKLGGNALQLSGNNTYSGATKIFEGALVINADNRLGTPPSSPTPEHLVITNGTLVIRDTFTLNANRGVFVGPGRGYVNMMTGFILPSDTTLRYGGVIEGAGELVVDSSSVSLSGGGAHDGNGTLILTGANTHSGKTRIAGGTLRLGDGTTDGSLASSGIVIDADGALIYNLIGNHTYAGQIEGAGPLTKLGAGTLTLSGANTYSGDSTITLGTLRLGAANTIPGGTGKGNVVVTGTLDLNTFAAAINGLSGAGTVDTVAGGTPTLSVGGNNQSSAFSGVITDTLGTLALTKTGSGTLTLSGLNGYSGLTTISAGTLKVMNGSALGSTAAGTLQSGTSELAIDGTSGAVLIGAEALSINGGGIVNAGALRNLAGNNTYGGTVTMAAQSRINSDSGTLTLNNATAVNGDFNLIVGGAGNLTISGAIAIGSKYVSKDGAGTLTLSGPNTYGGATTITLGTLKLGASDVIPDGTGKGNVTVTGTLDLNTFSETINGLSGAGTVDTVAGDTPTLTVGGNDQTSTFSGTITDTAGTLSLTKTGSGTLTLSGTNTFSGPITINQGTLSLSLSNAANPSISAHGAASVITTAAGANLRSAIDGVVVTAPIYVDSGASPAVIAAPANSPGGGTNTTFTINSVISGPGDVKFFSTVNQNGLHTVLLNNANTYSGSTLLDTTGGVNAQIIVKLGSNDALPPTTAVTIDGKTGDGSGRFAEINLNGFSQELAGLTNVTRSLRIQRVVNSDISAPATLTINNSADYTFSGSLGGANNGSVSGVAMPGSLNGNNFSLTKTGTGIFTLSGANTYTGATTVMNGTLQLLRPGTIANSSGVTVHNNGILLFNNNGATWTATIPPISLNGGSLTNYASANHHRVAQGGGVTVDAPSAIGMYQTTAGDGGLYLDGGLKGSAALTVNADVSGAAVGLVLRNTSSTYSGSMTVNGVASADVGVGSGLVVGSTGTQSPNLTNVCSLANATITVNGTMAMGCAASDMSWAAATGGNVAGLSGTTFQMDALNGTGVVVANFTTTGTRTLSLGNNNGSGTFSGVIAAGANSTLSLIKNGAGTQVLSGPNTYSGSTTVNDGRLVVHGSLAAGSVVTVASGATLSGTGTVGAVTVTGTFAPGGSIGTNTTGALTFKSGSTFEVEVQGPAWDMAITKGAVDLDGAKLDLKRLADATVGSMIILTNASGGITGYLTNLVSNTKLAENDPVFTNSGGTAYYIHYRPTYVELNQSPTSVVLFNFSVMTENGQVVVRWRTASEIGTSGFDLYRKVGADWVKLNASMIPAKGAPLGGIGAAYEYVDTGAVPGGTYEYKLVEILQGGGQLDYGPYSRTASEFRMESPIRPGAGGMEVHWLSREGERYRVMTSGNISTGFESAVTNLEATPPENVWLDTNTAPIRIYKVELE